MKILLLISILVLVGCHSTPIVNCEEGAEARNPANQNRCQIKEEWEVQKPTPSSVFRERRRTR